MGRTAGTEGYRWSHAIGLMGDPNSPWTVNGNTGQPSTKTFGRSVLENSYYANAIMETACADPFAVVPGCQKGTLGFSAFDERCWPCFLLVVLLVSVFASSAITHGTA